ncbi:hypothetical protein AC624_08485 [Bacillus sp. FJAT-27238]|nr:hypothetical protein AC624_08485 [Bacillus sp. FJAT-27238]
MIKDLKNNVTTILDQFIEEVHVPGNAAFHPKVWVLAYKHKEKEKLFHRLICMSRYLSSQSSMRQGLFTRSLLLAGADTDISFLSWGYFLASYLPVQRAKLLN